MWRISTIVFVFSSTPSNTGDLTWGHLEDTEVYGRKSVAQDYVPIEKYLLKDQSCITQEASHCLIYAKNSTKVFNVYNTRAVILVCSKNNLILFI